jgi:hypothetical protein
MQIKYLCQSNEEIYDSHWLGVDVFGQTICLEFEVVLHGFSHNFRALFHSHTGEFMLIKALSCKIRKQLHHEAYACAPKAHHMQLHRNSCEFSSLTSALCHSGDIAGCQNVLNILTLSMLEDGPIKFTIKLLTKSLKYTAQQQTYHFQKLKQHFEPLYYCGWSRLITTAATVFVFDMVGFFTQHYINPCHLPII